MGLEEYLGYLSDAPRGGFGSVPSLAPIGPIGPIAPALAPGVRPAPSAAAGAQPTATIPFIPIEPSAAAFALVAAIRSGAVDESMWRLDAQWLPTAVWQSMKSCIAQHDLGAGPTVQPWFTPCNNWAGTSMPPSCDWGYWRLPTCTRETAASYAFQFSRYLWAQQRMRDHLANRPVPYVTPPLVAADWCWKAQQLISVLLWSTNVRFDSGYDVDVRLRHATRTTTTAVQNPIAPVDYDLMVKKGLLLPQQMRVQDVPNGIWGHERNAGVFWDPLGDPNVPLSSLHSNDPNYPNYSNYPQVPPPRPGTRGTIVRAWFPSTTVFNYLGNDPVAPVDRDGFSPSFVRYWIDPNTNSCDNCLMYDKTGAGGFGPQSDRIVPLWLPNPSMLSDVKPAIDALTAAGAPEWQKDQVVFNRWFEMTWAYPHWVATPYPVYRRYTPNPHRPGIEWDGIPVTLYTTSAQWIADETAKQLTFYSDRTHTFFDWMNQALETYMFNVPVAPGDRTASDNRFALMQQMETVAAQAHAATMSEATGWEAGYVMVGFNALISLVSLYLPVVGLIYGALMQGLHYLFLLVSDLSAQKSFNCPTIPFIRVLSSNTPCTLTTEQITASLLGVDSNAQWPVTLGGQWLEFIVDGKTFRVTFDSTDTSALAVARRIAAGAVLVGLPSSVASVNASGQVHIEGNDPTQGAVRATIGTAITLGFPGVATPTMTIRRPGAVTTVRCWDGRTVADASLCPPPAAPPPPPASKPSAVPVLVGGAAGLWLLAKMFGGKAAVVASAAKKR